MARHAPNLRTQDSETGNHWETNLVIPQSEIKASFSMQINPISKNKDQTQCDKVL